MGGVLLLVAAVASLATIPLLWLTWFDANANFLSLFGNRDGLLLHPSAWEAFPWLGVVVVALALTAIGSTLAVARGFFVLWTAGAAAAIAGALVSVMGRESPPSPGGGVYTSGALALEPTAAPLLMMGTFLLAATSLTVWALGARARRA